MLKTCSKCGLEKEFPSDFAKKSERSLRTYCKQCDSAKGSLRIQKKRKSQLQNIGSVVCDICGSDFRLRIDHCHINGNVRGLLCEKCNIGLGAFNDNPDLLHKAWQYLANPKNFGPYYRASRRFKPSSNFGFRIKKKAA